MDEIQDERHTDWYWSDNEIIDVYGPIVGAYAIAVYSFLARYANNKAGRTCFPSHKTIADGLAISRSTVVRALEKLEEAGLIKVTVRSSAESGRPETSNVYKLLPVKKERKDSTPYVSQTHPVSPIDTPPIPTDIPPVSQGNTPYVSQTYKQDLINKTKETRARKEPPAPANFLEKKFKELAIEWGDEEDVTIARKKAEEIREGGGNDLRLVRGVLNKLTDREREAYRATAKPRGKANDDKAMFNTPEHLAKRALADARRPR